MDGPTWALDRVTDAQAFSGRKGDLAARSKRGLRGVALSESALAVL
jgi:hypothetical protein